MGPPIRHSVGVRDGGGSLFCGEFAGLKRLPQLHVRFVEPIDSLLIELAGFPKVKQDLAALLEGDTGILCFALLPKKFTQGELSTRKGLIELMVLRVKLA